MEALLLSEARRSRIWNEKNIIFVILIIPKFVYKIIILKSNMLHYFSNIIPTNIENN